ncbi:MAG: hypothetical protein E7333_03380 [Clostridiales bacterium]|nr:hypothetical protein [Clostridiales bacterium]
MGNFANAVFQTMLGWFSRMAQGLWNLINGENDDIAQWLADNWLKMAMIVCVAGLLIDFVIYLLRWQPHKVWASFLRRLFGRKGDDVENSGRVRRQWIYADGSMGFDEISAEEMEEEASVATVAPAVMETDLHAAYRRPVPREEIFPEEQAETIQQPEPIRVPAQPVVRRRRYVPEGNEEMPLRYSAPPVAQEEPDYHQPYVPRHWKNPEHQRRTTTQEGESGL